MKKKGFTLIETILCIAIISAVSLGMFFLIKKDKNLDDKKVQFQEKILLASSLYFDNKKNSNLHNIVYDYGGRGHIKLSDLIDVGLISDDLTNPYKNKSILDTKDECVHLYLDEDKDFVIEYPLKNEDRLCKNEVIDVPKSLKNKKIVTIKDEDL